MILLKELNANVNALCTSSTLKSISFASRTISAIADSFLLARDAFVKTNRRDIAMMFVRLSVPLSVCLSETGVHSVHTVHVMPGPTRDACSVHTACILSSCAACI